MDLFHIIYIVTLVWTIPNYTVAYQNVVNVLNFGAAGDGKTDDTVAFIKAWNDACNAVADTSTIIIPSGRTFLIQPISFNGPCKSPEVYLQLAGVILAPNGPKEWTGNDLLSFEQVRGLTINGSGTINGRGQAWWDASCRHHPELQDCLSKMPTTLVFLHCSNVRMDHIFVTNTPQTHVLVWNSDDVHFESLGINSPGDSPNTDGIHIQASTHVSILNSVIKSGDDCISIGDFIKNITIVDIFCGPGHGISIGSLGKDGGEATVEKIIVHRAQFFGTSNGVRIKTYQAGRGNVRDVSFVNLTFHEVQNPIIIDQHYCFPPNGCQDLDHAVHIDDVKYIGATGTSASELALNLNCSKTIPCTNINLENIQLGPASSIKNVKSSCDNAYGFSTGIVNPSSCLR